MPARGLEWVEARASNREEMKKFYKSVLGLPLKFEEERKDFIQYKVGRSKTFPSYTKHEEDRNDEIEGFRSYIRSI